MIKIEFDQIEQYLIIEALETTAMLYENKNRDKRAGSYYKIADKIREAHLKDINEENLDTDELIKKLE